MKKSGIITAMAAGLITCGTLASCDEVKEGDRYIDMGDISAARVVLLEEFTGQQCTNCPAAHEVVSNLLDQYNKDDAGVTLISVSIHAGSLTIVEGSNPNIVGLKLPEADQYADRWNVAHYPMGVVNRSGNATDPNTWADRIREIITRPTPVSMELDAVYDAATGKIGIDTRMIANAKTSGKLQLWITESGIVARQSTPSGTDRQYVHNHVYRGSVNGLWGEDITLEDNVWADKHHEIAVKENWVPENLTVVGFIYDDNEVIQAAECELDIAEITE